MISIHQQQQYTSCSLMARLRELFCQTVVLMISFPPWISQINEEQCLCKSRIKRDAEFDLAAEVTFSSFNDRSEDWRVRTTHRHSLAVSVLRSFSVQSIAFRIGQIPSFILLLILSILSFIFLLVSYLGKKSFSLVLILFVFTSA